jgi:hypothetical protein
MLERSLDPEGPSYASSRVEGKKEGHGLERALELDAWRAGRVCGCSVMGGLAATSWSSVSLTFSLPVYLTSLSRSLAAQFMESSSNSCEVPHRGIIVAKVLEYLAFKVQYKDATAKDYVPDFAERIEPEIALEVLMAADYLEGVYLAASAADRVPG